MEASVRCSVVAWTAGQWAKKFEKSLIITCIYTHTTALHHTIVLYTATISETCARTERRRVDEYQGQS